MDVTKLYQTLANQGGELRYTTVDSIADRQGNLIFNTIKSAKQVVPQEAAFQTLFGNNKLLNGTARSLQKDYADLLL